MDRQYMRGAALRQAMAEADAAATEVLPGLVVPIVLVGGPWDGATTDLAPGDALPAAYGDGYVRTGERASVAQLWSGRFRPESASERARVNVLRTVWRYDA